VICAWRLDVKYRTPPKEHQKTLTEFAVGLPFVGIFDKPGSGKTKMALDIVANREQILQNVYLILPAGLIPNWKNEIRIHYSGEKSFHFISYGLLSRKKGLPLTSGARDVFILDESHHLRNTKSNRTKYVTKYLAKNFPQIISMTGTPAPNDRRDLFVQAFLLNLPAASGGLQTFKHRYCRTTKDFWGQEIYLEDINTEELMGQFSKCAVFRGKSDFLDLEDKQYSPQYYELTPKLMKAFKQLRNEAALLLNDGKGELELVSRSIGNLLRLGSGYVVSEDADGNKQFRELVPFKESPKVKLLLDIIATLPLNEPIIIYTCFVKEVMLISELLAALHCSVRIRHGQLSREDKQLAIDDFSSGKARFLIATVQSTNEGFTLTHCSKIIYFTNSFKSVEREQSEDRIHRISQKEICVYYDLIANGMLDETVMKKLKDKIKGQLNWIKVFKEFVNTR
jgi:SNF2 family DNA or RNA helicase